MKQKFQYINRRTIQSREEENKNLEMLVKHNNNQVPYK